MEIDRTLARYKRPTEEFRISWDFVNDVETGDTLSAHTVTAAESDGTPAPTFIESPVRAGTTVLVQVQGGTAGKHYLVTFDVTTTAGDKFQRVVRIIVAG